MANAFSFYTWNPILDFDVIRGGYVGDVLKERTLSLTYTDRDKQYDLLEWQLDNSDGLLTQPDHLALGLLIRLRLGYIDDGTPWRSFIINRVRGGVGVTTSPDQDLVGGRVPGGSALSADNARITYSGRNRNAPDLKGKKQGAHRLEGRIGRGSYFRGGATSDVLASEMLLKKDKVSRIIPAQRTSDAVRELAEQVGFTRSYQWIEDTEDNIEFLTVPVGESLGGFLMKLADTFGYVFKIDSTGFHFHSSTWSGYLQKPRATLIYGAGEDILSLTIDGDFRLPIPAELKTVGHVPTIRAARVGNIKESGKNGVDMPILSFLTKSRDGVPNAADPMRKQALQWEETVAIPAGAQMAVPEAARRFIEKHMKSFKLNVTLVGNPTILATDLVNIKGTGCPLVDGIWYVAEAKHIFDGTTYQTQLTLRPPPGPAKVSGTTYAWRVGNLAEHTPKNGAPGAGGPLGGLGKNALTTKDEIKAFGDLARGSNK